ncbi:hypothetical protein [Clostridium frigidicarnis]|uniref:Protein kinase n=1 Tax=Clostridium frigidicarnis TaxID=84698 RepID=A0A1I1A1Z6_9CLOT|nr:hypothetical protein [Clostridium frigidicarnis]SFB31532.1 hypothetical protein SAMN04488528_102836 [Clostridium frigidicarnis]
MTRRQGFCLKWSPNLEKILRESEVLGHGNNGIVYLLPNGKVMKIFGKKSVCDDEHYILKKVNKKSSHFPKVYERGDNYMIRDYVGGYRLDKYLRKHNLNKILCLNLIELIKEFEKLGFTKLDTRCKDLYVQDDFTLMIIDPKQCYTKQVLTPEHLMKGLEKRNQLDLFLDCLKEYDCKLYNKWYKSYMNYLLRSIE